MDYLLILQIVITVALTTLILIQQRSGSLGSLFGGGGSGGGDYIKRRGMEKILFRITIGLAVTFIVVSLLNAYFG